MAASLQLVEARFICDSIELLNRFDNSSSDRAKPASYSNPEACTDVNILLPYYVTFQIV